MSTIYLIMSNTNIEFKNMSNNWTGWLKEPTPLYAFNDLEQAKEKIWIRKQEELERYKNWLKTDGNECFIHHQFSIKETTLFNY